MGNVEARLSRRNLVDVLNCRVLKPIVFLVDILVDETASWFEVPVVSGIQVGLINGWVGSNGIVATPFIFLLDVGEVTQFLLDLNIVQVLVLQCFLDLSS